MKRIFRLTISTHFSDSGLYFSMCRIGRIPSNLCCWRVIIKALQTINEHSDGNRWGNVNKLSEHNPTVIWGPVGESVTGEYEQKSANNNSELQASESCTWCQRPKTQINTATLNNRFANFSAFIKQWTGLEKKSVDEKLWVQWGLYIFGLKCCNFASECQHSGIVLLYFSHMLAVFVIYRGEITNNAMQFLLCLVAVTCLISEWKSWSYFASRKKNQTHLKKQNKKKNYCTL